MFGGLDEILFFVFLLQFADYMEMQEAPTRSSNKKLRQEKFSIKYLQLISLTQNYTNKWSETFRLSVIWSSTCFTKRNQTTIFDAEIQFAARLLAIAASLAAIFETLIE